MEGADFFVVLTLDVDPDANGPVKGRIDALSCPLEKGMARVEAVGRGLATTLELLRALDLPACLFFEARTARLLSERLDLQRLTQGHEIGCHSLRHEDFSGKLSGIPLGRHQTQEIIAESRDMLENTFHRKISGFRAPYLRINPFVLSALVQLGFRYDSSIINDCLRPFQIRATPLWEFAVASLEDGPGNRITSYLSPLFWGKKTPEDYLRSLRAISQRIRRGVFMLAYHPWELYVSPSRVSLSPTESRARLEGLESLLKGLKSMPGLSFLTLSQYIEETPRASTGT